MYLYNTYKLTWAQHWGRLTIVQLLLLLPIGPPPFAYNCTGMLATFVIRHFGDNYVHMEHKSRDSFNTRNVTS